MKPWKSILAPILIFILGTVAGGTVVALVAVNRMKHFIEAGPDEVTATIGARIAGRLDLDDDQRAALQPVLADLQTGFSRLRLDTMADIRRLLLDAEARLRPHLRPDQNTKLDRLLEGPKARWERLLPPERSSSPEASARTPSTVQRDKKTDAS